MTTIGSLSWAITANTSNFTAGLVGSRKELRDLNRAFEASISPVERYTMAIDRLQNLAAKFPSKAGVINSTIAKMRQEMAASSPSAQALNQVMGRMGLVMDPVSAAFKAFDLAMGAARAGMQVFLNLAGKVSAQMEHLDAVAKKSRLLGISEGSLVGLRRAASDISGVGADQFDTGLTQFTKRIAEAATTGKGDAAGALGRLGLNAGTLSGMTPDKAFLRTAEAMRQVQNPAERLRLAFELMGKQGGELATTLAAGDKEIIALMEDSQRLQQLKFIDFQGIESANDAMGRLKEKTEGLLNVMASEFSPVVKSIADDLVSWGDSAQGAEAFRDVIRDAALNVALLADELKLLGDLGAFKALAVWTGVDLAGRVNHALAGQARGWAATDPNSHTARMLAAQAAGATNRSNPSAPSAIVSEAAEQADKLADRIEAFTNNLKSQVETFGMGSDAAELYKLRMEALGDETKQMALEFAEQQVRFKNFREAQAKEAEAAERMEKKRTAAAHKEYEDRGAEIKKLQESLRSPSQKLRDDFDKLTEFKNALGPDAFGRGLIDLAHKADAASGTVGTQSIGAIRAGSVEALRAQFPGKSTEEKTLKEAERQTAEQKAMRDLLKEIRDASKAPALKEAV